MTERKTFKTSFLKSVHGILSFHPVAWTNDLNGKILEILTTEKFTIEKGNENPMIMASKNNTAVTVSDNGIAYSLDIMDYVSFEHFTTTFLPFLNSLMKSLNITTINTINKMECLEDDWDYEGAKRINSTAISNAKAFVRLLTDQVLNGKLTFFPTELGAVAFKFTTDKGIIRAEIGDDTMSYYIKRNDAPKPEYHSFEQWNTTNIDTLVHSLISIE